MAPPCGRSEKKKLKLVQLKVTQILCLVRTAKGNGTPLQYSGLENPMDGVGCGPWGRTELSTTERLHFRFSLSSIGERNGNPLQCSCLENPRDRGGWWAVIYGVAQSRTRLKWLSSNIKLEISLLLWRALSALWIQEHCIHQTDNLLLLSKKKCKLSFILFTKYSE